MQESMFHNAKTIRTINFLCLCICILVVLVLPFKKQIWYDETISIFCSKGIGHDLAYILDTTHNFSSAQLSAYNTAGNVFHATVKDNANSYLYNIGLHWFTGMAGNELSSYILFSKLSSIATLIALFVLCGLLWGNNLFTSLTVLLLTTDTDFIGMSHEIRAYSMAILFVTLAAIYFFKFLYEKEKPAYLFLLSLFSACAILSHFLSLYIILVFLGALLYIKKAKLFSVKNIVAIAIPVAMLAFFFLLAYPGLELMSRQNQQIHDKKITEGFNLMQVFARSIKFFALNFKAVFPAFINNVTVSLAATLAILALYFGANRSASEPKEKHTLNLLFALGCSSTLFLALLSIKAHHYTALYYRYYSFCLPFTCLFTAYALYLLFKNPRINRLLTNGIMAAVLLPSLTLFVVSIRSNHPIEKYNHITVAKQIQQGYVNKIEVPLWTDAFLINCLLPRDYKIDYVRNETTPYFTFQNGITPEQIPVLRIKE